MMMEEEEDHDQKEERRDISRDYTSWSAIDMQAEGKRPKTKKNPSRRKILFRKFYREDDSDSFSDLESDTIPDVLVSNTARQIQDVLGKIQR